MYTGDFIENEYVLWLSLSLFLSWIPLYEDVYGDFTFLLSSIQARAATQGSEWFVFSAERKSLRERV